MKHVITFLLTCLLQVSCAARATPLLDQATLVVMPKASTPTATTPVDVFEVVAWVSDSGPMPASRVYLYGSLIKNGVHLGGMAMRATWPDKDQERGVPNCSVQVIYGYGFCTIQTEGFPTNVYVPITVTFEYHGNLYSGQTGFTPQ